jgi:hypothetical protein
VDTPCAQNKSHNNDYKILKDCRKRHKENREVNTDAKRRNALYVIAEEEVRTRDLKQVRNCRPHV